MKSKIFISPLCLNELDFTRILGSGHYYGVVGVDDVEEGLRRGYVNF